MSWTGLLQTDVRWSDALRVAEKPGPLRTVSMVLAHSGDSWFWAIGLIALYSVGSTFWKEWALTQLLWISLLAVLGLLVTVLPVRPRRALGPDRRHRPWAGPTLAGPASALLGPPGGIGSRGNGGALCIRCGRWFSNRASGGPRRPATLPRPICLYHLHHRPVVVMGWRGQTLRPPDKKG